MAITYKSLQGYKYLLVEAHQENLILQPYKAIKTNFIHLTTSGQITISKGYAWDGPSGPTIDTRNFMRASLIHDALYQLMRLSLLDYKVHRELADQILYEICLEEGMTEFRAWYVHKGGRLFGEKNAVPELKEKDLVLTA